KLNVRAQKNIPLATNNYNIYKKISQLRKTDTLKNGDLQTYTCIMSNSMYILKRSLLNHESYIVVIDFGSDTETIILSHVVPDLKDTLYVYLKSENSAYNTKHIVSTVSSFYNPLLLRPQSVVVLIDKFIVPESPGSTASGCTRIYTKLISILCVFLFVRWML
ncbi:LOW QUALITY PROTEIN: maltase A3-like, partial [Rhopalosiphum padi]|uniref:LOW QUALITY PROTEIN: maltase A3-like n=1 Tax=Rhopalosiphum padi TaxID=40932 RepID=UPI00298DE775